MARDNSGTHECSWFCSASGDDVVDEIRLENAPRIFCLGLSYKSAPLSIRESCALLGQGDALKATLQLWRANEPSLQEIFILSTCNRFEIYVVAKSLEWKCRVESWFLDCGVDPEALGEVLYFYDGFRAVQHGFFVAASLDSMLLGETQITGQFKNAILCAKNCGAIGPVFHRLWQEVLRANKQVRSRTRIGVHTLSLSHAAIDLSKRIFRDLTEQNVLFIGAGEMIQIALRYVRGHHPRNIWIVNRTYESAEALIQNLETEKAYTLDALGGLLSEADVVVCCTGSQEPIITEKMMNKALKRRSRGPVYLMDLGLPRNIEPACSEVSEVYLFNLDDLKQVIETNRHSRESEAELAREMVLLRAKKFAEWLESHGVRLFLGGFHRYLEGLVTQEREKTISKEIFLSLSLDQKNALNQMLQSIRSKIVGDVAKIVHSSPRDPLIQDWIQRLSSLSGGHGESSHLDQRH